jgi:hypothetical protein
MQEAPESSTPASTSRFQPQPANLHGSRSQLDQGHTTATPTAPAAPGSSNLVRGSSSTAPLNVEDGYTSLDSVIDLSLQLSGEPYWDAYPHDGTALQAQVDELVHQINGQDPNRGDSAIAGHLEDRATSQYFGGQNDEYFMHKRNQSDSANLYVPPTIGTSFLLGQQSSRRSYENDNSVAAPSRSSRVPESSAAAARPFGCEEPGCTERFKDRAGLRYVLRKSE